MRFGPDGGPQTATKSTYTAYDAMLALAKSSGISAATVTDIQDGMGLTPAEISPYVVGLAAAKKANPAATPGQLATTVLGASSTQSQAIDKSDKATKSTVGQTGAFTDIFGDLFEVVYPFLMFGLGGIGLIVFILIALVAIAKSGAGKQALGAAENVAKIVKVV